MARPKGIPHSPEARAKIGEAVRKAMADPAVRAKLSKGQRRYHRSDDIPDHLWADYQTFCRKGYSKAEARKMLGIGST